MFESLRDSLDDVFRNLRGVGRISEANVRDAMREIRIALLEADVNYKVARKLMDDCVEASLGERVLRSVSPGQQIIKIFYDHLVEVMGPVDNTIPFVSRPPSETNSGIAK